jgi:hypothetical protein
MNIVLPVYVLESIRHDEELILLHTKDIQPNQALHATGYAPAHDLECSV